MSDRDIIKELTRENPDLYKILLNEFIKSK
jgi:hypothetical protein